MKTARSGRTVVITGGTAGVGRATARAFADAGDRVAVIARDRDRLDATVAELKGKGVQATGIEADVADPKAVERAALEAEAALGPIDVWVNNAMTSVFAPSWEVSPEEFERATAVTYFGVVHGTQAALRKMRPRREGIVIQVGSALAYRGIPLQSAYCGSKHAIVGFTESVRSELLHEGSPVRMTMVHLPAMNTPQFDWVLSRLDHKAQPVPPIYAPEVAARAIVWASTRNRREVIVGFPTFKTIWGNRVAPWLADRILAKSGYSSQQTNQPESSDRPSNLWSAVPGPYSAHGRFDDRSRDRSWWVEISKHRVFSIVSFLLLLALIVTGIGWAVEAL